MKKTDSLFKKIGSINKLGFEPIIEGKNNYYQNLPEIERIAERRALTCKDCENLANEPISFLRVSDGRIPVLNEKICSDCGCALPFLLRQNQKICEKW